MRIVFPSILAAAALLLLAPVSAIAQGSRAVVPGTGTLIEYASDDFEEAQWDFIHRHPKSSREQDQRLRSPTGRSTNDRWIEGPERGQPDLIKVVPTPPGGLEGSKQALMLRTLNSGIPGYISRDTQQDDIVFNTIKRLRGTIPVGETPSFTVRVYLPPADQWENRTGPHFGIRGSAQTVTDKFSEPSRGFFGSTSRSKEVEPYWPGIWVHFRSKGDRGATEDSAFLTIRGNTRGQDVRMKEIPVEQFGWWTFGLSFTPDGSVHYYASPGVDELTQADHITSQYPYGLNAQQFRTYFFNVCNRNDGKSWSTPFVIDDPKLYVVRSGRVERIVQQQEARPQRETSGADEAAFRFASAEQQPVAELEGSGGGAAIRVVAPLVIFVRRAGLFHIREPPFGETEQLLDARRLCGSFLRGGGSRHRGTPCLGRILPARLVLGQLRLRSRARWPHSADE